MSQTNHPILCEDEALAELIRSLEENSDEGVREVYDALLKYPDDPRLHFLHGSLLAQQGQYSDARQAMRMALDIEPDYVLARFQLGFLQLTSGEPYAAQESWGPLHALPGDNYIKCFVDGLCHLVRDEFEDTIAALERGVAINTANLPLNRDMQLIINEVKDKISNSEDNAPVSSAHLLLRQESLKGTRH